MLVNICEGCTGQPVPGILSHDLTTGHEYTVIERCDLCGRYGDDLTASTVFEVIRWSRNVIGIGLDDPLDLEGLTGNLKALDPWLADLLDDRSTQVF